MLYDLRHFEQQPNNGRALRQPRTYPEVHIPFRMEQSYRIRTGVLMAIRVGLVRSIDDRTIRHGFHCLGYELFAAIRRFEGGGEEYLHRENEGAQEKVIREELGKYERHGRFVKVFGATYNAD